jgi:hypothetical protein
VTINPTAFKRSAPSIAPGVGYTAKIVKNPNMEIDYERSDPRTVAAVQSNRPGSSQFVPDYNPTPTSRAAQALAAPGQAQPGTYASDRSAAPSFDERFFQQFGRLPTDEDRRRIAGIPGRGSDGLVA